MVREAETRGVTTADLLEGAGLTREIIEDPDARIPAPTVLAIWEALRSRTDDPTLQLGAPMNLPFGAYRVIDYLVAASRTVGEGVERFARFFRLIADAVVLCVERDGQAHRLRLEMAGGGAVPPVYVDYVFAALVGRLRMRVRPELRVARLELARPEPPETRAYREFFRCPVRFGVALDRLCFDDAEWTAPLGHADEALARLLEEHARMLAQRMPEPFAGFRSEVEQAIAGLLPERRSAADVARTLFVSVRTLQRKLAAEGVTFREVHDAAVMRLAMSWLSDPKVSVAEVAFLLGFSEPSSFNRAFRRWTGDAPGTWRRRRVIPDERPAPVSGSRRGAG
jgi:AraC-like DNA-binding protein